MPSQGKNKLAPLTLTKRKSSRKERGFTLIELMAAMTGGLFMTVAIYAFTRDVTEFFQRQMRVADATIAASSGFERLRADIARAGFLSSPNLARDQNRCPRPALGGAAIAPAQIGAQFTAFPGLEQMALARIIHGQTLANNPANAMFATFNGGLLDPDELILYGNYTTAEQFPVKVVSVGANQIALEINSAAMARLGVPSGNPTADTTRLASVFQPNRILRIVDETGREQYGILANPSVDVTTDTEGAPTLWLNPTVGLISKDAAAGGTCGLRGHVAGAAVNPVDIIHYQLTNLAADTAFGMLFDADIATPGDATRLDLVRDQLDPSDLAPFPNTRELIAEYAVDLKFGLTVNTALIPTGVNTYYGEDDPNLMSYADVPFDTNSGNVGQFGPHLIRGIHARLAVRTREAEFNSPLPANATLSEQLYRVQITPLDFARVRSLRAHIATRNSRTETWQ